MAIRAKGQSWQFIVLLVLAVAVWGVEQWKPGLLRGLRDRPAGHDGAPAVVGGYERIEGCRWVDHRQNDGDSFRVRFPDGRVEQLRLFFADAPESAFRSYGGGETNHERIADQARDMGVEPAQAVEIGKQAARRVEELLDGKEFTVFTEWEDPFDDRRFSAFVEMPGGGWLHEWLIAEGLARLHTKGAPLPGGESESSQQRRLAKLEAEAKR